MRKTLTIFGLLATAAVLSACGEKPQETTGVRQDTAPYTGVGKSQYQQPGWTVGDKASWEQQLKARAQYGMNDYTRVSTQ
jgi:outer membrane lipopolysaccharide assembly protein LptE/RlpB